MKRRHHPNSSHFKPGQSGNPRGRPKGRHRGIPHDDLFGQMVTVTLEGVEQQITAGEYFMRRLVMWAMTGKRPLSDAARRLLDRGREERGEAGEDDPWVIFVTMDVTWALRVLGAVIKLRPLRPGARLMLEPWIVQARLAALGDRHLTLDEQQAVHMSTRTPHGVVWPAWWGEAD